MSKKIKYLTVILILVAIITISMFATILNAGRHDKPTYFVTPNGSSENSGKSFDEALDLRTAITSAVPGDLILLEGGTYSINYVEGEKNTINLTQSGEEGNEIKIQTVGNSRALIDFSFPELAWVQNSYGFFITGNYWNIKGIDITHAGYQGAYVTGSHNTFENCRFFDNRNTGLEINKGGSYTTVINCDAFLNYDPKKFGSMADGFGPKQTMGPGNKFYDCRAWENSDDGFDCYDSPEAVTFDGCLAFRNGVNVWEYEDFVTNANGFKIGGKYQQANHVLRNCLVFDQPKKGFDQNNNTGGLTIYNCLAYNNGINFGLGNDVNEGQIHDLKNNISLNGPDTISNSKESNNSWNDGFSASENDFISLDTSLATLNRKANGSLKSTQLFKLKKSSILIDAGIDVGLPFNGLAPDLGAYEAK
ncbi:MAG: right-handed parallel beta-helix repeat-containing protein [Clostridiales bacterium]